MTEPTRPERTVQIEIPVAYDAAAKPPRKRTFTRTTGRVVVAMPFIEVDPAPVASWTTNADAMTDFYTAYANGGRIADGDVRPDRNVFHLVDDTFWGSPAPLASLGERQGNPLIEAKEPGVRGNVSPDGHANPRSWFADTHGKVRDYEDRIDEAVADVRALCRDVRIVDGMAYSRRGEPHLVLQVRPNEKRVVLYPTTHPSPGPTDLVGGLDQFDALVAFGNRLTQPKGWEFACTVDEVTCDYVPTVGTSIRAVAAYASWIGTRIHSHRFECDRRQAHVVAAFNEAFFTGTVDEDLLGTATAVGDVLRETGELAPGTPQFGEALRDWAADRWAARTPTDVWDARFADPVVAETTAGHSLVVRELRDAVEVGAVSRFEARRSIMGAVRDGHGVLTVHQDRTDHGPGNGTTLTLDPTVLATDGVPISVVRRGPANRLVTDDDLDDVVALGTVPAPATDGAALMMDFI